MDVFAARERLIDEYREFTTSFVNVRDERIAEHVERQLAGDTQWPEPWISLNPTFEPVVRVDEITRDGLLDDECRRIFRTKRLILEAYDAMQQSIDAGVPYQSPLDFGPSDEGEES